MSEPTLEQVDQTVKTWLRESRDLVLKRMATPLNVDQKTGRKDLVTNVDKENERLLVSKIRAFSPDSQVLGEEGFGDQVTDTAGWVWVVDPIDGTMNFVKQRDHFAMMIALYIDGQGVLGYIYDVINDASILAGLRLASLKMTSRWPNQLTLRCATGLWPSAARLLQRMS